MTFFRSIHWRMTWPHLVLILLVMASLLLYTSSVTRDAHLDSLRHELLGHARLMGDALSPQLAQAEPASAYDVAAARYAELLGVRVTIMAADGTVLGDSSEDRAVMDNHLHRPEIQRASRVGHGDSIRFSDTVGYDMLYVAAAVEAQGRTTGYVRAALPLRQVNQNVARLHRALILAMLIASLIAMLLSLWSAEKTTRPLRDLTLMVQRVSRGELHTRLLPSSHDQVGTLIRAFNDMTQQLHVMVTTAEERRSRLAAVLENMADGVLIADGEGRVRLINSAASRLLGASSDSALGQSVAQVVRIPKIIELWEQCCERGEQQEDLVELDRHGAFLQGIATPLKGDDVGACLLILQDLTAVRQLETVRRDFISNLSHELRTPLAALKALVDTLRDGALSDPTGARRFLDHMEDQVDSLTQMVQELLELARIESGHVPLRLESVSLADLVLPSVDLLRPQAERGDLDLQVDLPFELPLVLADAQRIAQVMTNLVHNACKFTPAGGKVTVSARQAGEEVVVSVRDTGVGISQEDIPRVFERFFKSERARSTSGTGLGLAIAKHIVQGHGGRIWVESVETQGSAFFFTLPVAK